MYYYFACVCFWGERARVCVAAGADAATEAALRRHAVFEEQRVSADLFNTDAALVLANPQLMVRTDDDVSQEFIPF